MEPTPGNRITSAIVSSSYLVRIGFVRFKELMLEGGVRMMSHAASKADKRLMRKVGNVGGT